MALGSGDQHNLLRGWQPFQLHILELHLHRRTGVQLQSQNAGRPTHLDIVVGALARRHSVDEVLQLVSVGHNAVRVPIVLLNLALNLSRLPDRTNNLRLLRAGEFCLLTTVGQDAAEPFAVQNPRVRVASFEVCLITATSPGTARDFETAVLDSRVGRSLRTLRRLADFVFQFQFEVVYVAASPNEKRVALGWVLFCCLTRDGSVFNAPELWVPIPTIQGLPIKESHWFRRRSVLGGRARDACNRKKKCLKHGVES